MAPLILLSKRNLNGGMKMYKTFEGTMITGASDDLIEIEGELVEEFDCFNCKMEHWLALMEHYLQLIMIKMGYGDSE